MLLSEAGGPTADNGSNAPSALMTGDMRVRRLCVEVQMQMQMRRQIDAGADVAQPRQKVLPGVLCY